MKSLRRNPKEGGDQRRASGDGIHSKATLHPRTDLVQSLYKT